MFPKMCLILLVNQVLLARVLVVKLLEVVDLVLVLVVAVVAGAQAEVGEPDARRRQPHPLVAGDAAGLRRIEEVHDGADDLSLAGVGGRGEGFVSQAVEAGDFRGVPVAVGVEVVEGEKGAGVEVGDVMFFCLRRGG